MTTFWHGGRPGRKRGEFLLPPQITGVRSCSEFGAAGVHRRDRVYVTTDAIAALMFAAGWEGGVVYEVEPISPIEADPDCAEPGLAFQCEKARVLRVVKIEEHHLNAMRAALAEA